MLSRRHIRIKVLQALYAYNHNSDRGMVPAEKQLRQSIEDIYVLYLYEMRALDEIRKFAEERLETSKNKRLPSEEDLRPNRRFVENRFFTWLNNFEPIHKKWEEHTVRFGDDRELLRRIFREFLEDEHYQEYMAADKADIQDDKRIVKWLYGAYITQSEMLFQVYEERSMHWADDLDAAQMMVGKTIKSFSDPSKSRNKLPELLKDQEDMDFALKLFRTTVKQGKENEERIRNKAQNWETDRIATIDILLMKMALAEFSTFEQIPVKVTLNEYIELSKQYSTEKSAHFINGILDKVKIEMEAEGSIQKIGRGLL